MKRLRLRIPLPKLRRSTSFGFVLSAIGLSCGGFGVARAIAALTGTPVSATLLVATFLTGLFASAAGFSLLVVGADPFDDADFGQGGCDDQESTLCGIADRPASPHGLAASAPTPDQREQRQRRSA